MPKVSVCVPVYNVERYIGRCIESIKSQSLEDIEIIVVNDCTPDKAMDIVRQYAAKDNRIKIIENEDNHGLMITRRMGYTAASGEYVTFCDSDDTLPQGALETLYNKAVAENADIVSGIIEYIHVAGKRYLWANKLSYGTDKIAVFHSLLADEFGHNLCSRLFRRELLQNYDYETYEKATNGEDGMLFYQVVDNASKIVTIDVVVYEYWQNMQSSSQVKLKENALISIARLNNIRLKMAGKYDNLKCLVDRKLSLVWWDLKSNGYEVDKYFRNEGLYGYGNVLKIVQYKGVVNCLKMMVKFIIKKII